MKSLTLSDHPWKGKGIFCVSHMSITCVPDAILHVLEKPHDANLPRSRGGGFGDDVGLCHPGADLRAVRVWSLGTDGRVQDQNLEWVSSSHGNTAKGINKPYHLKC